MIALLIILGIVALIVILSVLSPEDNTEYGDWDRANRAVCHLSR